VIAVSEAVRNFLIQEIGISPKKIEKILLGIEPVKSPRKYSSENEIRVGVIGRLIKLKGHDVLLEAWAKALPQLSKLRLEIFGSGPTESQLQEKARRLGIQETVSFRGFVSDPEKIYEGLDFVVIPSLMEGAGLVALEAMSRGLPAIASATGGIPEYLQTNCGILVPPGDSDLLAKAILEMSMKSDLRRMYADNCRRNAANFSAERMICLHMDLYRRCFHS
jgi:glycosyltransferase involved in cell wall biosynthesis